MKTFGKNLLGDIHLDPISRDILVVMTMGLLVAMAIVSIGFMIFH
ncbi:MAG: hypothetical protein ACOYW3_00870 [Bacteroidota bacterium]